MHRAWFVCIALVVVVIILLSFISIAYNLLFNFVCLEHYDWPVLSSPYQGYYINTYKYSAPGEFVASPNGKGGKVVGVATGGINGANVYGFNTTTTSGVVAPQTITLGIYSVGAANDLISAFNTPDASISKNDQLLINTHNASVLQVNCGLVGVFIITNGKTITVDPMMPMLINVGLAASMYALQTSKPIA